MKKVYFFSLVLAMVFLSACSFDNRNNISNDNASDKSETSKNTGSLNNTSEPQGKVANANFVYKNDDYQFQITFPNTWNEVIVKSENGSMFLVNPNNANDNDNKINFQSTDLVFGLPVKVTYQEKQDAAEKCPSCFVEIFRLQVLNKEDSRKFEIAREANIKKYGGNPSNNYRIVASNNGYVFYGPTNFFGQSYDGEFIKSRQTEAQDAVSNQFMAWN